MTVKQSLCLNNDEKTFFTLVDDAVKANPFSKNRIALDLKITGLDTGAKIDLRVSEICKKIEYRFKNIEIDIRHYKGLDKTILRSTILFVFFSSFS